MRDTRHLFNDLCERKPSTWDDVPPVFDPHGLKLGSPQMEILMKLPRKQVAWNSSPMDDIFPVARAHALGGPLEWVVERMGEEEDELEYFYVNNEGYAYARYAFRFTPRPV